MTTEPAAGLYFKQATISNILMLQDHLPQYAYTYNQLIGLSLTDLEYKRDAMILEYNEVIKERNKAK